jgi:hypothetical protein
VEHKGLLLCSQKPTTGSYSEPDESRPRLLAFSSISILIISLHLCLGLPFYFLTKLLISPMCATCSTDLTLLTMTTLIPFGEEYKLCSSSLCIFLQLPVTSSPNILLTTRFSNPSIYILSFWQDTKYHILTKQQIKLV